MGNALEFPVKGRQLRVSDRGVLFSRIFVCGRSSDSASSGGCGERSDGKLAGPMN